MPNVDVIKNEILNMMQENKVSAEELISIIKSIGSKVSSRCEKCLDNLTTIGLKCSEPVYTYCHRCKVGKVEIHAKIRAKKTIKSLSEPHYTRGHYLRFFYENKKEDNIHLNIRHPKELELRSGDNFILTMPFYVNRKVLKHEISNEYEEFEIQKLFDTIEQIEESKIKLTKHLKTFELYSLRYNSVTWSGIGSWELSLNEDVNKILINKTVAAEIEKIKLKIKEANDIIRVNEFIVHLLFNYMNAEDSIIINILDCIIENANTRKKYEMQVFQIKDNDLIENSRRVRI